MLNRFGLRAEQAGSVKLALPMLIDAAENDPYSVLIMGWRMPDTDGIEAIRAILGQPTLALMPIVTMASTHYHSEADNQTEGVAQGSVLTKPLTPSTLFDAIMQALGHEISQTTRADDREEEIEDALEMLAVEQFDGVLMDCQMPGMNDHISKPIDVNKMFSVMAR